MIKKSQLDQTRFSLEEPILEDVYSSEEEENKIVKPIFKRTKFWVLFSMGLFGFIFALVYFMPSGQPQIEMEDEELPPEVVEEERLQEFELRINRLKRELRESDSRRNDLNFPPIDTNISLED